jgi:FtsH-binding integral membrane protein
MANWSDPWANAAQPAAGRARDVARDTTRDGGLRAYMLSVYNYMASGVLLTGITALLFAQGGRDSIAAQIIMGGGILKFIVMLAPLGLVMWLSYGINRISEGTAKAIFWAYAVLMGVSLSTILLAYTGVSVAQTFFATAASFAALSLFGYTTKKDLSGLGTFLIMGVIGLVVAMLLNAFLFKSTGLALAINLLGVLIFAGLTAYDTQKIKSMYYMVQGSSFVGKSVVMGALTLYLDFINMFLFLLRFTGDRR